ncbi:uncharacterized protein TRUGW13939_05801 [Talaromyces rugulosus]|uniref:NADH:flavin oxidoreductase/NADH oxidase N-terminal domain-containing protein n=1 Tax=Talaromyces rugulosus TaxID=121627 RepID=A0A7H8QX37_TALRU|nr:uncharacterized protein TRUGW13939_05801 [Talaromyces rugulosus]QKX58674.1 hypothetical protein TRUGW13939_05801 [Talaromyces rugulosus]
MPVHHPQGPGSASDALGQPLDFVFAGKSARNRFVKAAMAETLASWDEHDRRASGIPGQDLINLYRRWGEGGWGTILTGNIQTQYLMPGSRGDMIIDPESPMEGERFDGFKHVAEAAKANGSLIIGQISHVGRKVTPDLVKEAISASAIPIKSNNDGAKKTFSPVRSASDEDIALITTGFAHAAEYLDKAGFDGVELHAAHGYLLAQFLSPTTNKRNDAYGGPSLSNRMRLLVEVVREIQRRTSPGFIIGVKLNSVEFQDGGFTLADARELCIVLQQDLKLDFLELSGGSAEGLATPAQKETTREREAFFLEFAEAIVPAMNDVSLIGQRKKTKIVLTGGLRSANGINRAIEVVDAVGIGRPATQKPSAPTEMLYKNVDILPVAVPPFDNNVSLGVLASQAQMKDICRGIEPFDLTNSETAARFLTEIQLKST